MEKEKIKIQLESCKDDINMLLHLLEDERACQITDGYIDIFNPTESLLEVIQSMKEYFK